MAKGVMILLLALVCVSSEAQTTNVLDAISPGLRQFLNDHPVASEALSNAVSSAFAHRGVQIKQFHSDDRNGPRSTYFPGRTMVVISLRDDLSPADEFIGLFYEIENSKNTDRVFEIARNADSGTITRDIYANQMLQLEFIAFKETRDMLASFKDDGEVTRAKLYAVHYTCPDTYDEFASFIREMNAGRRDPFEYFGKDFDERQRRRGGLN